MCILEKLYIVPVKFLLRCSLSFLAVLALVLGLASGAFAASSDYPTSGSLGDFTYFSFTGSGGATISTGPVSSFALYPGSESGVFDLNTVGMTFASPVISGTFSISSLPSNTAGFALVFVDMSASTLYQAVVTSVPYSYSIPSSTSFVGIAFIRISGSIIYLDTSTVTFSSIVYDSSGGYYDPSLDQDILSGVEAIAQSLLDLETGPYYGVSDVTVDQNGDLQHTVTQTASLEDLLNALGISGTDSNHVIRGIYNNFGSYFTLFSITDTTSGTTQVYRSLPQYVNALGQTVTDGINRLQRDHDILYQQTSSLASDLDDALYSDTDSSPSQSWSVADWLKGIYNALSSFVSSFWSPAETDVKSAAEDAMQESVDSGMVPSDSDISDLASASSDLVSFAGSVNGYQIFSEFDKTLYQEFWSSVTRSNLEPPAIRSSGSDIVDYYSDNMESVSRILGW